MNKVVDYFKQYIGVISIVLAVCILLTYSLSYFKVNTESKRAVEMYIGELKYTLSIDGTSTNTLSVQPGETIVDIYITNLNEIKTYFKLLYLKNSNVTISYYNETKDTSNNITKFLSAGDLIEKSTTSTLKLKIINNSTSTQTLTFSVSGGYSTNKLTDIEVPSTYSEITTLETAASNTYFCKITSVLTEGLKYIDGQYTYSYNQSGEYSSSGLAWRNISADGWGVQLTDKTSIDAVTSKLCTYINNKPVVSMSYMFYNSQATTLDLSSFNTSNVTNMNRMFYNSQATRLDLSSFNTSNVTNMGSMFYNSQATRLDLSSFNTSNVTNMGSMFYNSQATRLDLSSFNTSNVTNMNGMFYGSQATTIDLSSFNTNKVTNMSNMFENSQATRLDLSSFNTSNVTDMEGMFWISQATTLDLSSFDTSNVTNMRGMFWGSQATTLDLSSFDTSNVTDMNGMFGNTKFTSIDLSSFDISKVTNMGSMFAYSAASSLDLSSFDTSNVRDMSSMFLYSYNLKTIYVSNNFITDNVTSSTDMFLGANNLVGGNGTKYNSSYVDKTYARIDGGTSSPGYFTLKIN